MSQDLRHARMRALVPHLGTRRHGDVYAAAMALAEAPPPGQDVLVRLVDEWRAARDLERDLYQLVIARLFPLPAMQRALAPHAHLLDEGVLDRVHEVDALEPVLFEALAAIPSCRAWLLEHAPGPALPDAGVVRLVSLAHESLADNSLVEESLGVFIDGTYRGEPVPVAVVQVARELAHQHGAWSVRRRAFTLLSRAGEDLEPDLEDPEPAVRLLVAQLLHATHRERTEQVRIAIATDARLSPDLRREAVGLVRDEEIQTRVALELAQLGDDQAVSVLRRANSAASLDALELLVRTSPYELVRHFARDALTKRRRELTN